MKFSDARGGSYGAKKALRCVNWTAASETSRKRHWRVLDQPGQGLGHRESPLKAPSSHLGAGTVCQRGRSTANKAREGALGSCVRRDVAGTCKMQIPPEGRGNAEPAKLALVE